MFTRKNFKRAASIFLIVMILLLAGCGAEPAAPEQDPSSAGASDEMSSEPREKHVEVVSLTKDFGTYTLPSGWVESKKYSSESKFFYIVDGTEEEKQPDNISVECGKNKYSAAEHEKFRDAIVRQLAMQSSEIKATVSGGGFTTANEYLVYQFAIEEDNNDIVTTQYYIVSDYKYVLIHETAKKDSVNANEAAEAMVDSFIWAEN